MLKVSIEFKADSRNGSIKVVWGPEDSGSKCLTTRSF